MSLGSFFVLLTLLSGTLSCSKTPRRPKGTEIFYYSARMDNTHLGDYLLVVGGLKEYNRLDINDAEVVSLYSDDYSVPSCMYYVADFPVPIYETASGIINGGRHDPPYPSTHTYTQRNVFQSPSSAEATESPWRRAAGGTWDPCAMPTRRRPTRGRTLAGGWRMGAT